MQITGAMTSTPAERHFEEAMDWLLRLDEAPADAVLRDRHRAWLASDPLNALAWQQARKGWVMVGRTKPVTVPEWPAAPAGAAPERVVPFMARGRRAPVWIGIAAAACLMLAIAPVLMQRFGEDYITSTAETRQISLSDGSTVQLGPESSFSASLTAEGRTVRMSGGRAFFEVARDEARPFVVTAGDVSITVLGTAFDVRMNDEVVSVGVRHGRVAVRQAEKPVDEQLAAGDQITVNRGTGAAVLELVPETAVGSWAEGQLSVLNTPVSEVVDEIRRYHRGWIIIADERLASERVTGLYNLQKPDQALKALIQPVGGTMHQVSPFLTILSKSEK